jgi:HK97 family phage portal protein
MRLFGLEITKAAVPPVDLTAFDSSHGWWPIIHEPFTGAWQRNIEAESPKNMLGFVAVYASVSHICADVGKLRVKLVRLDDNGIWTEVREQSPFQPVLRKPNAYQTRIQFYMQWLASKLLTGNTYVWKERDQRGVVTALYVLDPHRVVPKVAEDGTIWYELRRDNLSRQMQENLIVPASEIIHDRCLTPWHPLMGVSPLYAAGSSTTQGVRIQANAERFFANQSRPGAVLSPKAPGHIEPQDLEKVKLRVEEATTGANAGRLLVFADEMSFQQLAIPPVEAQMIEQLRFTVEDVCRAYKMPLYKLGIGQPTFSNISQLSLEYYTNCLQEHIENIELLLDEGLNLPNGMGTEFDLDGLLRMDPVTQIEVAEKSIKGMIRSPNEARRRLNDAPVEGGDRILSQQQYWPIDVLMKRAAPGTEQPAPAGIAPPAADENAAKFAEFMSLLTKGLADA